MHSRQKRFCTHGIVFIAMLLCSLGGSPTAQAQNYVAYGWGTNSDGQLGNPTNLWRRTIAFLVSNSTGVVQSSASADHSLFLMSDGTVWACGQNQGGQLGDGTKTKRNLPVMVTGLTGVVQIATGFRSSLALKADGTVWQWGVIDYINGTVQTTPMNVSGLSGVVQIASGAVHALALKANGTVWAWGGNYSGALGDGTTTYRGTPVQVKNLTSVKQVSAGGSHSFAIKSDGTVWAWGSNSNGQLGDGTNGFGTDKNLPEQIVSLTGTKQITGGEQHSLAIQSDGTVWTWGNNLYGQLGQGDKDLNAPTKLAGLTNAVQVAGGTHHSLVVKSDGTVWGFGENAYAQIGTGNTDPAYTPIQVLGLKGVVQVSAGTYHSLSVGNPITPQNTYLSLPKITIPAPNPYYLAVKMTLQATGAPIVGESIDYVLDGKSVGSAITDSTGVAKLPMQPSYKVGTVNYTANYVGNVLYRATTRTATITYTAYDSTVQGNLSSWGWNYWGQLGNGTTIQSYLVSQVLGISNVVQASAGYGHSLALKADGTVWAWGYNNLGQVGDGTADDKPLPVKVKDFTKGVAVVAGWVSSLALKADGTVWQWGGGTLVPAQVTGLSKIVQIASRENYYLALKSDGTLWRWPDSNQKVYRLTFIDSVVQVVAGTYHILALKADGTVWGWGENFAGQLGNGTTKASDTPVQIPNLTGVIQISAGTTHSLALKADGTVWAWGSSGNGQIGDGTYTDRWSPVQSLGLSGVTQVVGGMQNSYALKADGTVWVWGDNGYGQRAGADLPSNKPAKIPNLVQQNLIDSQASHAFSARAISRNTVMNASGNTAQAQYAAPLALEGNLILQGTTVALPIKPISFFLGTTLLGQAYTVASGTASLPTQPIPVGTYTIKAAFLGNPLFNASSQTASLTIIKADTSLSMSSFSAPYGATATLKALFRRASDKSFPPNFTVEFSLDGTSLGSVKTDSKGNAILNYKIEEALVQGAHTLKAAYVGDSNHNPCVKEVTLTVNRANSQISEIAVSGKTGDTVTLTATLLRATDSKPLANRTVSFFVAGAKVGSATTDANGVAKLSYKITQATGTYKLKVQFLSDTYYVGSTDESANLTVK